MDKVEKLFQALSVSFQLDDLCQSEFRPLWHQISCPIQVISPRCQPQPGRPRRRRSCLSDMPTPEYQALPKSSQDHSTSTTNWKHPTHRTNSLLKPTEAAQSVSHSHPRIYSKSSNISKNTGSDRRASSLTLPERSSESLLSLQSDLSSPILVWSNVNQVLTSYVLLDLMIV